MTAFLFALTWPSLLATYSFSPFPCSPRWTRSHRPRRRTLSVLFRRTLGRWGSRTRGAVRRNRRSTCRSVSRGASSLLWSACKGLHIVCHLVLGLEADQDMMLHRVTIVNTHRRSHYNDTRSDMICPLVSWPLHIGIIHYQNFKQVIKLFSVEKAYLSFGDPCFYDYFLEFPFII